MVAKKLVGPIDEAPSPEVLEGHVVTPGPRPRIHGYDVEADLARHYGLVESVILSLTGDLPSEQQAKAARVALGFFAATSVAEAPAHAAAVAQICGGRTSSVLAVGAVTLADQAHSIVSSCPRLLSWLDDATSDPPDEALARCDEDRESVARLRQALAAHQIELHVLDHDLARDSALIAVLYEAGVKVAEQIEALLVMCRLPCVAAEAFAWRPRAFRKYPMNLPRFRYEEEP